MSIQVPMSAFQMYPSAVNSLNHYTLNGQSNHYSILQGKATSDQTVVDEKQKMNKTALSFQIHRELDRVYVQVIDQETQEVVREVPPEQILDLLASLMNSAGLIVDQQV